MDMIETAGIDCGKIFGLPMLFRKLRFSCGKLFIASSLQGISFKLKVFRVYIIQAVWFVEFRLRQLSMCFFIAILARKFGSSSRYADAL